MSIRLIHSSKFDADIQWSVILDGVYTLSQFESRMKKYCNNNMAHLSKDEQVERYHKRLGDVFEVFVEFFLKSRPFCNITGICYYKPFSAGDGNRDVGVDGEGIGINGNPATVQIKFRSNKTQRLTANDDHLTNFTTASWGKYKVKVDDTKNMLIITNCAGLHHYTENEMFFNKVRCLNGEQLALLVDNIKPFWDQFRQSLVINLTQEK